MKERSEQQETEETLFEQQLQEAFHQETALAS